MRISLFATELATGADTLRAEQETSRMATVVPL
jgi:hypothetical protein